MSNGLIFYEVQSSPHFLKLANGTNLGPLLRNDGLKQSCGNICGIFMDKIVNYSDLLGWSLVSHHNLNISDTFFCDLQVRHQLVVEAEHL